MTVFCDATDCANNEDSICQLDVLHLQEELRFPAVCDDYEEKEDEENGD